MEKEKARNFFERMAESKTLKYTHIFLNLMVFSCLLLSGLIIIKGVDKILGSIILIVMALYLVLNRTKRW